MTIPRLASLGRLTDFPAGKPRLVRHEGARLACVRRGREVHVLEEADELKSLAVNKLGEEGESFAATPAISGGAIFVRSDRHLWCFSEGGK